MSELVDKRSLLRKLTRLRGKRFQEMQKMSKGGYVINAGTLANQCAALDEAIDVIRAQKPVRS
jgi:hypothetical protein